MGGSKGCLWWAGLTGTNAAAGFSRANGYTGDDTDANSLMYGITVSGGSSTEKKKTGKAAMEAGEKLSQVIGNYAQEAFKNAQGDITINFGVEGLDGCKTDDHIINCGITHDYLVQTLIHEFGHVFDNQFRTMNGRLASDYLPIGWDATTDGYL
jgi:hypothetical protein